MPREVMTGPSVTTAAWLTCAPCSASTPTKPGFDVAWRPSSRPSSARIEGAAQIAATGRPVRTRSVTAAMRGSTALRLGVPGMPPGRTSMS